MPVLAWTPESSPEALKRIDTVAELLEAQEIEHGQIFQIAQNDVLPFVSRAVFKRSSPHSLLYKSIYPVTDAEEVRCWAHGSDPKLAEPEENANLEIYDGSFVAETTVHQSMRRWRNVSPRAAIGTIIIRPSVDTAFKSMTDALLQQLAYPSLHSDYDALGNVGYLKRQFTS